MSRISTYGCIAFIVTLCSSSLFAGDFGSANLKQGVSCELRVKERYQFYNITGKTPDDLRKQMKQNGTKWNDGIVYSAQTTWDIHFSYDVSRENGRYGVKSANTRLEIIYYLPRMVATDADPELTLLWHDYLGCLQSHEFGHKDIAVKTATEINEILASIPSYQTEDELAQEITRRTEEKFKRLKDSQVEYDHETRHGETQGAILRSAPAPRYAGAMDITKHD
ncbi:MAG TPA: hypothetical protein DCZ75_04485 [Geobacter sp.]|nr:hypothetical protein [Geobacter sp.]